ncbi:hypothetical protein LOK49_LG05G03976 [Camellia lanceoleosa]|uniref:Uncharacterized protein n=1 Tax=Camellia lanceoleosa TaxID=1840588 RepID=A0ACC0HNT7_9ERIC|nr:hypothetical protein LOK49_LG05G03976 [Camellia lanceoleosa]
MSPHKGTEKRIARELEEEIENLGGHLNAYTSREHTTYYAKVMDNDVPKRWIYWPIFCRILSLMRIGLIGSVEGQTDKVIFDHLHATTFQYTLLGRTILGPVITASGAMKHEDIVEQVKKLFTKLSTDPTTTSELVAKEPAIFIGSKVRIIDDDIALAQFAVAFNGASWTDPDSIALMVIQSMLGSWNKNAGGGKHIGSSEIAENMMAFKTNYKDTGLFGVYAIAKPDCLDELAYAIMYEMSKLCYRVSEADVTRACNQLKSSLLLHKDGTSPVVEDIRCKLLTYGRIIPFAELFAIIDAVDASTAKGVAIRFIFDQDVAITAIGPIQGLPDYNWFRCRIYWLCY